MSYQSNTKERCYGVSKTLAAVEEAREILARLEYCAERTANKEALNLEDIAAETHRLRDCVDNILIGLVYARSVTPWFDRKYMREQFKE